MSSSATLLALFAVALWSFLAFLGAQLRHVPPFLLVGIALCICGLVSVFRIADWRVPAFPTAAVGGFCLFSGLFSLGVYFLAGGSLETIAALTGRDWVYLVLLGAGPMGLAFFIWDAALKRGDPRVIGSLAYLTPLTSTLTLVVFGQRELTWVAVAAMGLIVGGAVIGSRTRSLSNVTP